MFFTRHDVLDVIENFKEVLITPTFVGNQFFDEEKGPMVLVETPSGWFYGDKDTAEVLCMPLFDDEVFYED